MTPIDKEDIRQLAEIMRETGLTSLQYAYGDTSVKLRRDASRAAPRADGAAREDAQPQNRAAPEDTSPSGTVTIRSPMVGVFYCAPGEGESPYVTLGDSVRAGDTLCIIEAMKMMNEITAERDGVIVEVCASNKQAVDYGHPLFRMKPGRETED